MRYSLFIGRFQPPHKGHFSIIDKLLEEGKNVLIAIRDTELSEKDPLTAVERTFKFYQKYLKNERVKITVIDDIEEVVYGREVGYNIRKLKMPKEIEEISGTKIRKNL